MFLIDNRTNKIKLTKGDTATIFVQVFDTDGKEYKIQDSDVVTLTVKKPGSDDIKLQKTATPEHYIIIQHNDTANLPTGTYKYDVQLVTEDLFYYTIVPDSYFELTNEVTV